MKIVVAPGAFKHSLSAETAAQAMALGLQRSGLKAEIIIAPIADGGNGTLAAFMNVNSGGQLIKVKVNDPLDRPIEAEFGLLDDGTAVVEMALASGLELLERSELDPLRSSTFGTGQLLKAALEAGAKRVIVGVGGSATVDGGAGCAQALGVALMDAYGQNISHGGGNLQQLFMIDSQGLDSRWKKVEVLVASDVDNPVLGERGAAAVFGPQKGANPQQVAILEENLRHFFMMVRDQLGKDVMTTPGSGAAGALAGGLMTFLNARIESGVDLILRYSGFVEHLRDANLVITGEGHLDEQTIGGKAPLGVARLAREHSVPTVALVGGLNVDDATLHAAGIHAALPVVTAPMTLEEALSRAEELVERAALRLGYMLQLS